MSNIETENQRPLACEIADDGAALRLEWPDGRSSELSAVSLWTNCPSAAGRRRRMDGLHHNVDPALRLTKMNLIGRYAVNLGFSDGHDRGVYPWSLLAEIAARPTIDDFITDTAPDTARPPADSATPFMTPTNLADTSPANLER